MSARDEIDRYIAEVEATLRLGRDDRARVVAELRAHFHDALAAEQRRGASEDEATTAVLARMGDPRQIAARYGEPYPLLDTAVLLGAVACAGVAGWLFAVALTVLPGRDPEHVATWAAVAAGFAAYAALSGAYLRLRRRHPFVTVVAAGISAVAILAGAWFAVPMILTSGDFEGYIVLIGLVLAGQGATVVANALLNGRRRPAAV